MTTDLKAQILEAINDMINVYRMMPLHNGDDEEYREKLHAQDQIHHAIALLSDPNVFIGRWESMESAPRDGTAVLIFDSYSEDKKIDGYGQTVAWVDCNKGWTKHTRNSIYIHPTNPKAWAHLPPAPEEKKTT